MKVSKANQQHWAQYFYITFMSKAMIIIIKRNRFNTFIYMHWLAVVWAQISSDMDYVYDGHSRISKGHFWRWTNVNGYILPVLVLACWCWSKYGRIWFSSELQSFSRFSKWILSNTRIITKILWMNFTNHKCMTWPFFAHYMPFGCVQLHRLFKPNNL